MITLAGRLGLAASLALAGCSSSASQDPSKMPASEAVSSPEAAPREGSTQVASSAGSPAPQPEEGAKSQAMIAGDPAEEVSPKVAAECSRLSDVMNREAPRMIPKGSPNEVAMMTSIAKEADATADAIAKVKLSTAELVTFRDRIVATVRNVGQAARGVAKAMQAGDNNAERSALKELGDNARTVTTTAEELHSYCKGEQPAR